MEILKRQPVSHPTGSKLGKADYDVNVAVEYRHQLQILIYDEWTLPQMAMGFTANYYTKHTKRRTISFDKKPYCLHTKSIKKPSPCHPSL